MANNESIFAIKQKKTYNIQSSSRHPSSQRPVPSTWMAQSSVYKLQYDIKSTISGTLLDAETDTSRQYLSTGNGYAGGIEFTIISSAMIIRMIS